MTFVQWLDQRWPTERQWVTIGVFVLAGSMLKMAEVHKELWNVELFKTLLTLVVGTGIVNMVLAFWFSANKSDDTRAQNTGKLADAFKSVAENTGSGTGDSADAKQAEADGAQDAAASAQQTADEKRAEAQQP